jgi:hypothetical protein
MAWNERHPIDRDAVDDAATEQGKPIARIELSARIVGKAGDHTDIMAMGRHQLGKADAFEDRLRFKPLSGVKNSHCQVAAGWVANGGGPRVHAKLAP